MVISAYGLVVVGGVDVTAKCQGYTSSATSCISLSMQLIARSHAVARCCTYKAKVTRSEEDLDQDEVYLRQSVLSPSEESEAGTEACATSACVGDSVIVAESYRSKVSPLARGT